MRGRTQNGEDTDVNPSPKLLALLEKANPKREHLSEEQLFLVNTLGMIVGRLRRVGLSAEQVHAHVSIANLGIDDLELGRQGFDALADAVHKSIDEESEKGR